MINKKLINNMIYNRKVYGSEDFTKMVNEYCDSVDNEAEEIDLKVETYRNAIVLPHARSDFKKNYLILEKRKNMTRQGGVFDENFNIVDLSKDRVSDTIVDVGAPQHYDFGSDIEYADEDVIYLGFLANHFGHFIVESLRRLWIYLDRNQDKKAVYISDGKCQFLEIIELFGLKKENLLLIEKPTRFRSVTVPEASHIITSKSYNVKYNETYKRIIENSTGYGYDKIYLSRGRFAQSKVYGEEVVEKIFEENGFKIVYPETLTIVEQIGLMKNCKHLAGIQGSALHLSLFAPDGIELTCLYRCSSIFNVQELVNKMKNIKVYNIEAYEDILPILSVNFPYRIRINEYLKKYFRDNGFIFRADIDDKLSKDEFLKYVDDWVNSYFFMSNLFYIEPEAESSAAEVAKLGEAILRGVNLEKWNEKPKVSSKSHGKKIVNKINMIWIRILTSFIVSKNKRKMVRTNLMKKYEIK